MRGDIDRGQDSTPPTDGRSPSAEVQKILEAAKRATTFSERAEYFRTTLPSEVNSPSGIPLRDGSFLYVLAVVPPRDGDEAGHLALVTRSSSPEAWEEVWHPHNVYMERLRHNIPTRASILREGEITFDNHLNLIRETDATEFVGSSEEAMRAMLRFHFRRQWPIDLRAV